jgi:hypothetical protein
LPDLREKEAELNEPDSSGFPDASAKDCSAMSPADQESPGAEPEQPMRVPQSPRFANDGRVYTFEQFQEHYKDSAEQAWSRARRAALVNAFKVGDGFLNQYEPIWDSDADHC